MEGHSWADPKYLKLDGKAYPEVFTTIPANQPKERKPGQLTEKELKHYFEEGYVQVDDYFTRDELDPARDATAVIVDELAEKLFKAGRIKNLHKDVGLFQRMSLIEEEYPGASVILHKTGELPKAYRDIMANDKLLNAMEQILGTQDIEGSSMWNLRCKTPNNTSSTVPWHQDSGYMDVQSHGIMLVTGWIPLLDSNEQNGCLQMVRKAHSKGLIAKHTGCWKNTWYLELPEEEMEKTLGADLKKDVVLCPVPYGGVVLFSNILPHRSLNNLSNDIRWSLDLRWARADVPDGWYGLKDDIQLRSSTDPNFTPDWEKFLAVDRNTAENTSVGASGGELNPIICGPWMMKWPLTNHNQHTAAVEKLMAAK